MLSSFLENYGFSKKQAKIYLASLELGVAPNSSIARYCKENRLTTYSIIKELMKKGMFQEFTKDKVKFYSAVSPKVLFQNYKDKYDNLKNKLPDLMSLINSASTKPTMTFFEGKIGLKQIYDDILKYSEDSILSFLGLGDIDTEMLDYLNTFYVPKRVKKKIFAKVIVMNDTKGNMYIGKNKGAYRETIPIENLDLDMANEIQIYGGNKIAVVNLLENELSGVIIQNQTLHNTLKAVFNLLWNTFKKGTKND